MVYLLVALLAITTLITYYLCKDIFHPAVLFSACYTISAVVAALSSSTLGYDINFKTVFIIELFTLIFCVPCCFFRFSKTYRNKSFMRFFETSKFFKLVSFFFVLVITILYYRYIINSAILGGYGGGIQNIFTYAQKTLYSSNNDYSMGFILNYGLKICKALGYIIVLEIVQNIVYKKKNNIISYLIFILYILQCLLSTGRTKLFYLIIYILLLFIIISRQKNNWVLNDNFKVIKICLIVFVCALVSFWLIGINLRGSIYGTSTTVWRTLSTYIGGPIYSLDIYLQQPTFASQFGEETLYSFYGILSKVGFNVETRYSFLEFVRYGYSNISNNVYGAIRRYVHDYNYFSPLIVAIEGIFFGKIYSRVRKKGCSNFNYIFYATSIFAVIFFFFEERFLIDVLSTSNLLSIIICYVIYRYFTRRTKLYSL